MSDKIDVRRKVYCARHRHSNVLDGCFGYMSCARCGEQVGDSLAGSYSNYKAVIVDHDCDYCKENVGKLTREDLYLLPTKAADYVAKLKAEVAA